MQVVEEEVVMLTLDGFKWKPVNIESGRDYYFLDRRSDKTTAHDFSYKCSIYTFTKGALHRPQFCEPSHSINQSWITDILRYQILTFIYRGVREPQRYTRGPL